MVFNSVSGNWVFLFSFLDCVYSESGVNSCKSPLSPVSPLTEDAFTQTTMKNRKQDQESSSVLSLTQIEDEGVVCCNSDVRFFGCVQFVYFTVGISFMLQLVLHLLRCVLTISCLFFRSETSPILQREFPQGLVHRSSALPVAKSEESS